MGTSFAEAALLPWIECGPVQNRLKKPEAIQLNVFV